MNLNELHGQETVSPHLHNVLAPVSCHPDRLELEVDHPQAEKDDLFEAEVASDDDLTGVGVRGRGGKDH